MEHAYYSTSSNYTAKLLGLPVTQTLLMIPPQHAFVHINYMYYENTPPPLPSVTLCLTEKHFITAVQAHRTRWVRNFYRAIKRLSYVITIIFHVS